MDRRGRPLSRDWDYLSHFPPENGLAPILGFYRSIFLDAADLPSNRPGGSDLVALGKAIYINQRAALITEAAYLTSVYARSPRGRRPGLRVSINSQLTVRNEPRVIRSVDNIEGTASNA